MESLELFIDQFSKTDDRIVLVLGNFDLLHPGHIRLLKFAKECGDKLIVGINNGNRAAPDYEHRLDMIRSIDCVDFAFINTKSSVDVVSLIKPWAVVKGAEYEQEYNPELEVLDEYGGKLIFGSGDFSTVSSSIFKPSLYDEATLNLSELKLYAQRHAINLSDTQDFLNKVKNLNVVVLGEAIVDEYIQGAAVGMSQEDPTIVMTPTESSLFLGGAAITAGHLRSLGAGNVSFISVVGEDSIAEFVGAKCKEYQLSATLHIDYSRPSPLKTRYRVDNKTLLRVNRLRQHKISKELQQAIYQNVEQVIGKTDLLVFSDFNYGLLPQSLVDRICSLCSEHNVMMVADSQTSSQVGDISRFKQMTLVTPTEKEVRVALNNNDDGLVVLADKLYQASSAENIVVTLGNDGIFIHLPKPDVGLWENDRIPALNKNAIDPAGGGDCFLAAAALMMAAGADVWPAYYVASIAAACQVGRVGNTPLEQEDLAQLIESSFL